MSFIHFKSAYSLNYDKITFDGVSLSVSELKKMIAEKCKLTKQLDFDLEITNADSNQVYSDNDLVVKNSRVIYKRVVKNATAPLRAQPPKPATQSQTTQPTPPITTAAPAAPSILHSHSQSQLTQQPQMTVKPMVQIVTSQAPSSSLAPVQIPVKLPSTPAPLTTASLSSAPVPAVSSNLPPPALEIPKSVYDSLAPLDLPSKPVIYEPETVVSAETNGSAADSANRDEKAKLESIMLGSIMANSSVSSGVTANTYLTNRFLGVNKWPRQPPGLGAHGSASGTNMMMLANLANRPLPPNYVCTICKKPGHHKHLCPEAGLIQNPIERPKLPSGIPRTNLLPAQADDKFAMLDPGGIGYVVNKIDFEAAQVTKKDRPAFLTDEEEQLQQLPHHQQHSRIGGDATQTICTATGDLIPKELKCPFGDHIIRDAVLVPCCGHFVCCDECIKHKISMDENIECPHAGCDQEIGSLSSITPYHDIRKKVTEYLNELKLTKSLSVAQQQQSATSHSMNSGNSNDPFLDLILNEVGTNPNKPNTFNRAPITVVEKKEGSPSPQSAAITKQEPTVPNGAASSAATGGAESPLQDRKVTSSEQQSKSPSEDDKGATGAANATPVVAATVGASPSNTALNEDKSNQAALLPTPTDVKPVTNANNVVVRPPELNGPNIAGGFYQQQSRIRPPIPVPSNHMRSNVIVTGGPMYNSPRVSMPQNMPIFGQSGYMAPRPNAPMYPMQPGTQVPPRFGAPPAHIDMMTGATMSMLGMPGTGAAASTGPFNPAVPPSTYPILGPQPGLMAPQQAPPMYNPMMGAGLGPSGLQAPTSGQMMPPGLGSTGPGLIAPPMASLGPGLGPASTLPPNVNTSIPPSMPRPGIMSEAEFYHYQERLRKEADIYKPKMSSSSSNYPSRSHHYGTSTSGSTSRRYGGAGGGGSRRSRSRSRSRNRRSYSRSASSASSRTASRSSSRSYSSSRSRSRSPSSRHRRSYNDRRGGDGGRRGMRRGAENDRPSTRKGPTGSTIASSQSSSRLKRSPNKRSPSRSRSRSRDRSKKSTQHRSTDAGASGRVSSRSPPSHASKSSKSKSGDENKEKEKDKKKSKEGKDPEKAKAKAEKKARKEEKKAAKVAEKRPSSSLMPTIDENQVLENQPNKAAVVSSEATNLNNEEESAKKKSKSTSSLETSSFSSISDAASVAGASKTQAADQAAAPAPEGTVTAAVTTVAPVKEKKKKSKKDKSKKKHKTKHRSSPRK